MPEPTSTTQAFDHGLSSDHEDETHDIRIQIAGLVGRVAALPRHRSLSLAVTQLEQASHWLRDRLHKPAGG